ncbi:hypothetical protein VN97_g3165 [Penicillium thymicola]|uniref:Uncharacterized protein n=1 Tax=Penicillium thymicola TaxID=293382 RepID=A0AAI9XAS4_PENTH|nr:hypothetical protein VN97_g3165 [Penicillium thymicola]
MVILDFNIPGEAGFHPAEELYDIQDEPNEIRNLRKDREYQSVLEEMRSVLEKWQRRAEDAWLFQDGVSLLFVGHHLEAGFEVPDRIGFDVDAPEVRDSLSSREICLGVLWQSDLSS